jgi:hypothetical protein
VWNETERFFADQVIEEIKTSIGEKKRIRLDLCGHLTELLPTRNKAYDDVEILETKEKISVIRNEEDQVFVIGKEYEADLCKQWKGKSLRIPLTDSDEEQGVKEAIVTGVANAGPFYPFRTITVSPNLFMALVPAKNALDVSLRVSKKYRERMGKVTGRLPFAIANIFFPKKMPMFAVLDAARRMRENFREVSKFPRTLNIGDEIISNEFISMLVTTGSKESVKVEFSPWLGNGEKDYYYPYFIVKDKERQKEKFFLDTPLGTVAPWNGLDKTDVKAYVNLYDFEFLDSSTRRLFVSRLLRGKRYHPLLKGRGLRPYLLEQLEQGFAEIWEQLIKTKTTDTQIKGLEALMGQKFSEWQMWRDDDRKRRIWENFLKAIIISHSPDLVEEREMTLVLRAGQSGMLFDCLELYSKILKEKLGEQEGE